jgi:hypothetical protein
MILSIWLWIVILGGLYVTFHTGHGVGTYRHSRARGNGRRPSLYLGARGPWISLPVPGTGFRIGHRL